MMTSVQEVAQSWPGIVFIASGGAVVAIAGVIVAYLQWRKHRTKGPS